MRDRLRLSDALLNRIGKAPVDAYPWEATVLFANDLNWSPRPVCQSYTAYQPDLDEANARHYRSPDGPRFILYYPEAIDDEHPYFVDPLTLQELFLHFDVIGRAGRFRGSGTATASSRGDLSAGGFGRESVSASEFPSRTMAAGCCLHVCSFA